MFSKIKISAALAIIYLLISCAPKSGEAPPSNTQGELGGTECLSETALHLKNFVNGEASDREVETSFDCMSMAFDKFNKYVRGREEDRYYSSELARFFEKYFISKDPSGAPINKISVGMQTELMKVKQMLVGGTREYVSRTELIKTKNLLGNLKRLAVQLNPYMKVYMLKWKISGDQLKDSAYFEDANAALQKFSGDFSGFILPNHEPYSFQDFISLLNEVSGFYNESWGFVDNINLYLPMVKKIKKTVAGGAEDAISPGEWRGFLLLGARAYVQYARYFYFLHDPPDSGASYVLGYITREIEDVLSTFEDLVRQKPESALAQNKGRITRAELTELLESVEQVLPGFKVSEDLINEGMLVKQVLFGGQAKEWTSDDFANARKKMVVLKPLLEKFMPYYRVYSSEWNPSRLSNEDAQIYFREAQNNLEDVMRQIGGLLEAPYSLDHLGALLAEIEKLYPSKVATKGIDSTYGRYKALVQNVKNLLYEDRGGQIEQAYWPSFLAFGSRIYILSLNYRYFIQSKSWSDPGTMFGLRYFIESSLDSLEDFLNAKKSHQLALADLTSLGIELQKVGVFPVRVQAGHINSLVKVFLDTILNPPARRLAKVHSLVFDQAELDYVRDELMTWAETELFTRNLFGGPGREITLSPFSLQQSIDEKLLEPGVPPTLTSGLKQLKNVLASQVPLVVDSEGRMLISAKQGLDYNGDSVSRLNLTRAVSRLLIQAYSTSKDRLNQNPGLTKAEANVAFVDLGPLFVDLGYLAPDNTTFVNSRFLEANLFVPRGNGDDYASFLELNDILNMILSGIKQDSFLHQDIVREILKGVEPVDSQAQVDYTLLLNTYRKNIPLRLASSLPDFVAFLKNNNACDTEMMFYDLIKAAGYVPNAAQKVRLSDVALLPHIIQYVEMTLQKFDLNKDGTLDRLDAEKAFPVFQPLFKTLAADYIKKKYITEADLFPLFTYVLKTGKIPSGIGDFLKFMLWKSKRPQDRNFNSDRNKLVSILGAVADQVSKSAAVQRMTPSQDTVASHFSATCQTVFFPPPPQPGPSNGRTSGR